MKYLTKSGFPSLPTLVIVVIILVGSTLYLYKNIIQNNQSSKSIMPSTNPTASVSPEVIDSNFTYNLPSGWSTRKETNVSVQNKKYTVIIAEKGDYKLEIGAQSTGRAKCDYYYNNQDYKTINNKNLGNKVIRQNPQVEKNRDEILIDVCSNLINTDTMEFSTKIGNIVYILPLNWHQQTLEEMDLIVASLKNKP